MKKYKTPIIVGLVVLALFVLLALPKIDSPNKELVNAWNEAGVDCLNGHQNVAAHYHPTLTINLPNKEAGIPSDIGIVDGCMAEVHTHDSSGELHIESTDPGKQLVLSQFFTVWDKSLESFSGYELEEARANDQVINTPGNIILQDGVDIVLDYKEATGDTNSNSTSSASN